MIVRFSPRAKNDLADIAHYIRSHNPAAAQRIRAAILAAVETIGQFPESGRRQNFESIRKFVISRYPYLVYYTVDVATDEIIIVAVQHAARDREYSDL